MRLESRVTDFANALSFVEWSALEKMLKQYEDTAAVAGRIVLVHGTGDQSTEAFASRLFLENRMDSVRDQKAFMILLNVDKGQAAIRVGAGLDNVLAAGVRSRIVNREIVPRLQSGGVFAGLLGGLDAVMSTVGTVSRASAPTSLAPLVALILVVAVIVFYLLLVRPRLVSNRRLTIEAHGMTYDSGWGYRPPEERSGKMHNAETDGISGRW